MRQVNVLSKVMDCFVGILDRMFDARRQMAFQVFQPVFAHDQSRYAGDEELIRCIYPSVYPIGFKNEASAVMALCLAVIPTAVDYLSLSSEPILAIRCVSGAELSLLGPWYGSLIQ
jgi:hypothetical protein